jgi:hypothetical protein
MNARRKTRLERLALIPILIAVLEVVVRGDKGELAIFEAEGTVDSIEAIVVTGKSIWGDEAVLHSSRRASSVTLGDAGGGIVPEEMSVFSIQAAFAV